MPKANSDLERFVLYLNPDAKEDEKMIHFLKRLRRMHRAGQWLRDAAWAKYSAEQGNKEVAPKPIKQTIANNEQAESADNPLDRIKNGLGI